MRSIATAKCFTSSRRSEERSTRRPEAFADYMNSHVDSTPKTKQRSPRLLSTSLSRHALKGVRDRAIVSATVAFSGCRPAASAFIIMLTMNIRACGPGSGACQVTLEVLDSDKIHGVGWNPVESAVRVAGAGRQYSLRREQQAIARNSLGCK